MMSFVSAVDAWAQLVIPVTWQLAALALIGWLCERAFRLRQGRVRYALWWCVLIAPLLVTPGRMALQRRQAMISVQAPAAAMKVVTWQVALRPMPEPRTATAMPPSLPAGRFAPLKPALRLVDLLGLAWLVGCAALALRLAVGHQRVRRLLAASLPAETESAREMLSALAVQAGITGEVALRVSEAIGAPVLYGWRRPTVLVPKGWLESLNVDELRAMMAHEVAHVKRRDFLANTIQRLIEIPLFFHPGAWLASRRIALAREELCDAWALSLGADAASYARSLAAVAERTQSAFAPVSLGIAESRFTLLRRVEAIMEMGSVRRISRPLLVAVIAVGLVSAAAFAAVQVCGESPAATAPGGPQADDIADGSAQGGVSPPITAQWLVLGALKNQGMSPMFESGYVEMLHERSDLKADQKRAWLTRSQAEYIEAMLEHHRKAGASDEELARRRRKMEQEMEGDVNDIVAQLARRVTYERCLFVGSGPLWDSDAKTRIDRINVRDLDVPLSDIPKDGLAVVVTEMMGTPQSVCAGYGYGPGADEAYLQQNEYFPRPQDFGRIHGSWAVSLSLELMDDPEAFDFSFEGEKAREWLALSTEAGANRGLRIVGPETLESSRVYIVEASALGKVVCKVWIAPALGFAVPRIELYEHHGEAALSPNAILSEVMECTDFIHLDNPDVCFPLLTKYTRYGPDGNPQTVGVYKVFGPKQVAFNLDLSDDAFRILFKRGTRLQDGRPHRPNGTQYYGNGLQADLHVLPSELAALVDKKDPSIIGESQDDAKIGL